MKKSVLVLMLALSAAAAHADTGSNLSFEAQSVNDGSSIVVNGYTGWSWDNEGALRLQNPIGSNLRQSTDGTNYAVLWTNATVSQSFATVVGQTYTLSFDYDTVVNAANFGIGQNVQTLTGTAGSALSTRTVSFVASSANTVISFSAGADANGQTGKLFLDNVSLTAAVPEPETAAMFLAGLAAIGALSRRRRPQA
jgi:hypothetical protein